MPSIFEFKEEKDQFTIYGRGIPIIVALNASRTCIEVREGPLSRTAVTISAIFGLYEYYRLSGYICNIVLRQKGLNIPSKITKPFANNIGKSIGHRLHGCWRRLISQVPIYIQEVQKAIFAVSPKVAPNTAFFTLQPYKNHEFCEFIRHNRAAAVVASTICELSIDCDDWIESYSQEGLYPELAQTLENIPGGIQAEILFLLKRVRLSRPVKGRLRMLTLLYFIYHHSSVFGLDEDTITDGWVLNNFRLIEQSSDKDFEKAIDKILVVIGLTRRDLRKIKNVVTIGELFGKVRNRAKSFNELVDFVIQAYPTPVTPIQSTTASADATVTLDTSIPLAI